MFGRRLPIGRLATLAAAIVAIWAITQGAAAPRWKTLRDGLEFATLRGDRYCRGGSAAVAVLRIDPTKLALRVRHYTREADQQALNIVQWQRRHGALAVFNAGQYYPDYSYMGLLVAGGEVISRRQHPEFKAALVAFRYPHERGARVIDLDREPLDPKHLGWSEVAQSFMLFDEQGRLRVRKSDRTANRTAVAEDRRGRLLVFTSEGAYTLSDFATLLQHSRLELTNAMSMDGGFEAEMCVAVDHFRYASFGRWDSDKPPDAPGAQVPLPAVIEVVSP
jgi:uncharacterized protein YigE (DUF2233 family)